jgi:subtilisin family serine protease
MGMRMLVCGASAAAVAFTCTSVAFGGRLVSVGYRVPTALHGLQVVQRVPGLHIAEVRVRDRQAERALRARRGIRFVQRVVARVQTGGPVLPDAEVAAPPEWQWSAMHADLVPQWVLQQAAGVTIAIVDTGADLSAPTIAAKHPITHSVATGGPLVHDAIGHGTFVASLAAGALTDPAAMSGFGGLAQLMIVQANRGGSGFSDLDEANAIVWAVDHGAKIVNLSLGGGRTSRVERAAVEYAIGHNVLLVAAAGNAAQQGNPVIYPAALIAQRGLVVGASTVDGDRAPFSSTGSYVDVLAPGVNVLGALAGGILPSGFFSPVATPGSTGSYGLGSGTSYAAPEVAGVAALVWAANPALDAAGVAAVIEGSASSRGVWTQALAYGNVDAANAVAQAASGASTRLLLPPVSKPKSLSMRVGFKAVRTRRARGPSR